jgi:hypothetical protein
LLSEDVREEVAFCLWALCRDGLQAAPFDRHPPGDAELLGAGLDASAWKRWLRAVMGAQDRHAVALRGGEVDPLRRAGRAAANPVWFAPPNVRGALARYWRAFRDEGRRWRTETQPGLICRLERDEQRAFVNRVAAEAPGLQIYLAPYPVLVTMAIPPRSIVLGIAAADHDTARLAHGPILEAISSLPRAARASRL